MTSTEKQQIALHFWSLIPASCNSGCHGDPDAFGLHRPALGRPRFQGWRAGKCAPLAVPVSTVTPLHCRDTWAGQSRSFPTAQGSVRRLQAAPETSPSHTAMAPVGQVPAVPPLGLHLPLLCHTLRQDHCSELPQGPTSARRLSREAEPAKPELHHSLTLQHSYKFCYDFPYLLKQQIRRMPLLKLFNTVCCPQNH